jgi:hypothetical protein
MDNPLLAEIEAFLAETGMAPTTFGAAMGDRHFVRQLRSGRRVWPETADKARSVMAAHLAGTKAADAA